MTIYSVGITKHDQAHTAVAAHPGLTSATLREYVPGIGSQVQAAGILTELARLGRIEQRKGRDLWEYFPILTVPAPVIQDMDEPESREIHAAPARRADLSISNVGNRKPRQDTKLERALALIGAHPGMTMAELEVIDPTMMPIKGVVSHNITRQQVEKRRGGAWGYAARYWLQGEVPEEPPQQLATPRVKPPPKPTPRIERAKALAAEFPGCTAREMVAKRPELGDGGKLSDVLCYAAATKAIDRRHRGGWGREAKFWPLGQAPEAPPVRIPESYREGAQRAGRVPVRRNSLVAAVREHPGLDATSVGERCHPPMKSQNAFSQLLYAEGHQEVSRARKGGVFCWWPYGEAPADDGIPPRRHNSPTIYPALRLNRAEVLAGDFGVDVEQLEALMAPAAALTFHKIPEVEVPRFLRGFHLPRQQHKEIA